MVRYNPLLNFTTTFLNINFNPTSTRCYFTVPDTYMHNCRPSHQWDFPSHQVGIVAIINEDKVVDIFSRDK